MAISVKQKAKNAVVYQVQPMTVTLPATSAATGSQIVVVVQGAKNAYPYPYGGNTGASQSVPGVDSTNRLGSALAVTPAPVISDNGGNTYTQIGYVRNYRQSGYGTTGAYNPDDSFLYPSVWAFVGNSSGNTGSTGAWPMSAVTIGAFYPDGSSASAGQGASGSRPVYDGGLSAEVYEIAGVTTGIAAGSGAVTSGTTGSSTASPLGVNLVTAATGGSLAVESLILIDSSVFSPGATGTGEYILSSDTGPFLGGSSYWANVLSLIGGASGSNGFNNPLSYSGAVMAFFLR